MIETFPPNSLFIKLDQRQKRWAIPYDYNCLNSRVENLIVNNSTAIKDKRVLDLGCHFGTFAYASLKHKARFVHGVDSEERLILQAKKLFKDYKVLPEKYNFSCNDVIATLEQLEKKSYDTILCLGIFYYINDPVNFLRLMKKVSRRYIIIDTSPAHRVSEVNILANYVDGIILVVRAGYTPREIIKKCIENLGKDKILGIVFNAYDSAQNSYDKYYKNY